MTTIELYRHEKARRAERLAPLIAEARVILDGVAARHPWQLSKPARDKAYYETNKERIRAQQQARRRPAGHQESTE